MDLDIEQMLDECAKRDASDIHLTVAKPPLMRVIGELVPMEGAPLTPKDVEEISRKITNEEQWAHLMKVGEVDFSISAMGKYRFRANIYRQRGSLCIALRRLSAIVPDFKTLGLPDVVIDLAERKRGLVLVTGTTGSGKTTTLASMIDYINEHRACNVITLEDPVEILHKHKKATINQREIGNDTASYSTGLRAILRQDPDVILIGEMRDYESISIALTAAETGHLVFSTLHTIGAAKTIDRIIDVFPSYQQNQVRMQLSMALEGVITQQLLAAASGDHRVLATEVMIATPAIKNLIREGKTHQISNVILTSASQGMHLMDNAISNLYKAGEISIETAIGSCVDKEMLLQFNRNRM